MGLKGYTHDVIPTEAKRREGISGDFPAKGLGLGFAVRDDDLGA